MKTLTTTATDTDADRSPIEQGALAPTLAIVHDPGLRHVGARVVLGQAPAVLGRTSSLLGAQALEHALISREHVRVTVEGASLLVEDLGSRNGTWLNGVRVGRAVAGAGDVVEIGPVLLLFYFAPAAYSVRNSERIVGRSAAIGRVLDAIDAVARHATSVLLLGETGTGKELAAREIHEKSGRRGDFVGTNCASLPSGLLHGELFGHERGAFSGAVTGREGLFETAHKGTLLLDEIGDASPEVQAALLRVLQEKEVRRLGASRAIPIDTRVLAATHRPLEELTAKGGFREDLLARLSTFVIEIPPLRDRREDIPYLVVENLRRLGERRFPHRTAALALLRAAYPRNVRQLEAAVERMVRRAPPEDTELRLPEDAAALLGPPVRPSSPAPADNLPLPAPAPVPAPVSRGPRPAFARDKASLERLLEENGGNVTRAAEQLRVGRNTLYRWLREASVSLKDARDPE